MRITLIIAFCFLFLLNVDAQVPYRPIDFQQSSYHYKSNSHLNTVCDAFMVYKKDTFINNITYSVFDNSSYQSGTTVFCSNGNGLSFLRNDSTNKKVYLYDQTLNIDTLLYDFDLGIGDTLRSFYTNQFQFLYLDSIDSIQIGSLWFKRFGFKTQGGVYNFIVEGLGGLNGFYYPLNSFEHSGYLNCYSKKNIIQYPSINNGQSGNCLWSLNVTENKKNKETPIVLLKESILFQREGVFSLLNINGQTILKGKVNKSQIISTSHLPSDLYILHFSNSVSNFIRKVMLN